MDAPLQNTSTRQNRSAFHPTLRRNKWWVNASVPIAGLLQRLTSYRIPVVGLELLRSHPLSLGCIQTHGRRFLLARPPFYWAFSGVVCSIPCDLPYGLRHHVIFGPGQIGRVARMPSTLTDRHMPEWSLSGTTRPIRRRL